MFTGIIQSVGNIAALEPRGGDLRLRIRSGGLSMQDAAIGDSIAVEGVCLTVVTLDDDGFEADISRETLGLTTLGSKPVGARINLEKALTLGQPLGGHLLSGHVDGLGRLLSSRQDARSTRLEFEAPAELARYIARKGSIAVNGVSLTVNIASASEFDVNLVPHTLSATTLAALKPGDAVNLEVDQIARYLERLMNKDERPS